MLAVRGIESEIEQIESRNGTYPLAQALLEFLYTISTTAVPKNLGAGTRKPGLDPYLTFVVETVFLRFYNRQDDPYCTANHAMGNNFLFVQFQKLQKRVRKMGSGRKVSQNIGILCSNV